jgi:hypothetical protein
VVSEIVDASIAEVNSNSWSPESDMPSNSGSRPLASASSAVSHGAAGASTRPVAGSIIRSIGSGIRCDG